MVRLSIKAFCKYGLDKTTTKKLAEEANLSEAGLYIYFKNKEELLHKCVEEHLRKVKADIGSLVLKLGSRPDAFVQEVFNYTKNMLLENRFIFQVLSHPHYSQIIKDLRNHQLEDIKKQAAILEKYNVSQETALAVILLFNSALNNYILTQDEDSFMIQMEFLLRILKD